MVKQISVFIQNESGKIASIVQALADAQVDIRALSIADTTDFGILRMLVNDVQLARETLAKENCMASVTDVVVAAVPDQAGGLASLLTPMAKAGVNIEYMYSLIGRADGKAYMIFRVSNEETLVKLLSQQGISTVSGEALGIR